MSDCCATCPPKTVAQKQPCPACNKTGRQVAIATILHHLNAPWQWQAQKQSYYFCQTPDCEVVYFNSDGTPIEKSALRTTVGIKEKSLDTLICYCFGVSKRTAMNHPEAKAFVLEKTKAKICACDSRNPSGKCCLKDFH